MLGCPSCGTLAAEGHKNGCSFGMTLMDHRDLPHPSLSRNDSKDPTGEKLAKKIRMVDPGAVHNSEADIKFSAKVIGLAERTTTVIEDMETYGEAKGEQTADGATAEVSMGWFMILENWPVAIRLGLKKPENVKAGDVMDIEMRVAR